MLTELRIARAYAELSSILEEGPKASVSLAWIGNCELRMIRLPETGLEGKTLFWLELFDHSRGIGVDSFRCHKIEDATPVFEDLMWQAAHLTNDPSAAGMQ